MTSAPRAIFWFRRDLRIEDNTGLYYALRQNIAVLPIFIFDTNILNKLEDKTDSRVNFIYREVQSLGAFFKSCGSNLMVLHGDPLEKIAELTRQYQSIEAIYFNADYEPYARQRDQRIIDMANERQLKVVQCKDSVVFEKSEIMKSNGEPYTVFTPYKNKWLASLSADEIQEYSVTELLGNLWKSNRAETLTLDSIGFKPDARQLVGDKLIPLEIIKNYHQTRDFPGLNGTSRLSVHLRFGTISIRAAVVAAKANNQTWLNELIWRDFYQMIIWHFPHAATSSFKPAYDRIPWRNNEVEFDAWRNGNTGYPIVDAGMRELNSTGFMHNRVRMITASFLTKHLLIDWRWGEQYFANKLLDYDLASNVGGWQWAASSGCDAAPYFRVFNPSIQTNKFDPNFAYIKKWVPEFQELNYPKPIVEHTFARNRAIATFRTALNDIA